MAKEFVDKFPLDGEVYLEGDVRIYVYQGYLVSNTDQCAVRIKGETNSKWVDRSKLRLPEEV